MLCTVNQRFHQPTAQERGSSKLLALQQVIVQLFDNRVRIADTGKAFVNDTSQNGFYPPF